MNEVALAGVAKAFGENGDWRWAVRNIDLTAATKSFVAIVGPSGCGKSTLFRLIAGLEPATAGEVRVGGKAVTGPGRDVAYMFQNDLLVEWRDVLGNATMGGELAGLDRKKLRREAIEWLVTLHLGDFIHARPHELSGGMRQRVALARTLLTERPVLLLDEPFGALDSLTRRKMQELLLEVWSRLNRTVLLVTHDIDEALILSDKIYVMRGQPGNVIAIFDVDLGRPRHGEVARSQEFFEMRTQILSLLTGDVEGVAD